MNTVATSVVGIDVSKRTLDIALLVNNKIKTKVLNNTASGHRELSQWLLERGNQQQTTHLCMEATGPYSEAVAIALVESGWSVSVVNPARIKGFSQGELARNKTDRADAALLARFCMAMRPPLWTPPTATWRELRGWVDRLQALKDMHQQEMNRLEAHQASGQTFLLATVQMHLDWLRQQIEKLERDIDEHIDRHPELKHDAELLHSIPGIGSTTVAKVLAYAGNVRRFSNAKALAAFIGVTPRQRLSGTSVKGRTMMSRTGHADLRRALYMPGLVARRHNPTLKVFGDRLKASGLAPKAVVGAVMRKLAHLIYGVIKSGRPFDVNFSGLKLDFQDGI
ncbi:MAG: IS110 family transposase [Sideroxydans sp.]|nr:IS110 family transposase [Sideroxydans sp.]